MRERCPLRDWHLISIFIIRRWLTARNGEVEGATIDEEEKFDSNFPSSSEFVGRVARRLSATTLSNDTYTTTQDRTGKTRCDIVRPRVYPVAGCQREGLELTSAAV